MFEGTKRKNAPFWIPPLDILKFLGLFACLGLSLFRACSGPVLTPLTVFEHRGLRNSGRGVAQ